jgi:hypothetical protein
MKSKPKQTPLQIQNKILKAQKNLVEHKQKLRNEKSKYQLLLKEKENLDKKKKVANDIEQKRRINIIEALFRDGYSYSQVVEYCDKEFKIKKRQSERYIALTRKKVKEYFAKDLAFNLNLHIRQRFQLYRKVQDSDPRTALHILQDIAKLQNVYPSEKIGFDQDAPFVGKVAIINLPAKNGSDQE